MPDYYKDSTTLKTQEKRALSLEEATNLLRMIASMNEIIVLPVGYVYDYDRYVKDDNGNLIEPKLT